MLQKLQTPDSLNMHLVINQDITLVILSGLSHNYLCNHSTLDIGVFGYTDVI
jgi:hypothetical protein